MNELTNDRKCDEPARECAALPEPVRMNYFHGQLISERDLRTEQGYFRDKLRHMHRCLHGYGVLCGMAVEPVPPPEDCLPDDCRKRKDIRHDLAAMDAELECLEQKADAARDSKGDKKKGKSKAEKAYDKATEKREKLRRKLDKLNRERPDKGQEPCGEPAQPLHLVKVTCGAAVDCCGNDLILGRAMQVDVMSLLKPSEREKLSDGQPRCVYLSACYQECGQEKTRPFALDECATTTHCEHSRIAEGVKLTASLEPPHEDMRCDPCCTPCDDPCLLLAKLEIIDDEPIEAEDIDHSLRRRFGLYDPTVITSISWRHGATYTAQTSNLILGTRDDKGGIKITFSRPVHVSTLQPGVIDLFRITGGRGLAGVITSIEGEYVDLPADGKVDWVRYRDTTGETVQQGDRIMIVVRGPFILDHCCRPVEGLHIGGRVPVEYTADEAGEAARKEATPDEKDRICKHPSNGPMMPWTTLGSGNFESWFSVAEE